MEVLTFIQNSFVQVWWWLQTVDLDKLTALLTVVLSSYVGTWIVQHVKRRWNIDLLAKGKALIITGLGVLSYAMAAADWFLVNVPTGFVTWSVGAGSTIFTMATLLHRLHVSAAYDRLSGWLLYVATSTAAARQSKYGTPAKKVPVVPPLSFE